MASIVIWGRIRELLSGDPGDLPVREVGSLSELRLAVDGAGGSLVVVDPARLEGVGDETRAWLRDGGGQRALLVGVAEHDAVDDTLRRFPFLEDVLSRPLTPFRLRQRLERTLELVQARRALGQLEGALARKSQELTELNRIGVALSAQRDIDALLELILRKSREITSADAGSLYLVERGPEAGSGDDRLRFKLTQNDSVVVAFEEHPVPLSETSIAGYVALSGDSVNVADAYHLPPGSPFKISRSFDERSGYRTKSMLVVPMRDHKDEVIGVVQLINKKTDARAALRPVALVDELVVPFTSTDVELVSSLASQAAVALENTRLLQDIRKLFDSFVRASVTAIEQRDPTTSGHSERVALLTVGIAERVDALDSGPFRELRFSRDQLQELRYASLLHDFGKVGVREKVLIKGKKLFVGEVMLIRQRFAYIKRSLEADFLRAQRELLLKGGADAARLAALEREHAEQQAEVDRFLQMVLKANEPSVLEQESFLALMDLPNRTFRDLDGNLQPFLTANEVALLSIRRGSLSEKERREIESHVTHTFNFLAKIPWTQEFASVPTIAYAHHEKLDGSGYPRRLAATEIPIQSRMMTIADIYDALVAWDRPYKKAVPVDKALAILSDEAGAGKLDRALLEVFVGARVFERTLPQGQGQVELAR